MLSAAVRAEEQLRELPIDSIWIGALTLLIFVLLIVVLLVFGKGRPHA